MADPNVRSGPALGGRKRSRPKPTAGSAGRGRKVGRNRRVGIVPPPPPGQAKGGGYRFGPNANDVTPGYSDAQSRAGTPPGVTPPIPQADGGKRGLPKPPGPRVIPIGGKNGYPRGGGIPQFDGGFRTFPRPGAGGRPGGPTGADKPPTRPPTTRPPGPTGADKPPTRGFPGGAPTPYRRLGARKTVTTGVRR